MSAPTLSPPQPKVTPPNHQTTNREFLGSIFTGLQDGLRPMVLGIKGAINAKTKWPAGVAWTPEFDTGDPTLNWYFTLSVYTALNDDYRRRKEQFKQAFGVMLDDIGTKAAPLDRLAGLPPSYVIETSAGNHQAGYLFDVPCAELKRVEALQESLVQAGLCDPGAKGPSARVGRLPVGINGKYSPPHQCRLIEFHPDRRYSIEQIVAGLELAPVAPAGDRRKPRTRPKGDQADTGAEADVYRPRAKENAVLGALRQRGLYKQPLGSGVHDITCPWRHEHTDQIDHGSAYFEPSDLFPLGGYKCQHSHGADKRIGALIEFLGITITEAKHKPAIRVAAGELHRVVDAAEQELAAAGRHYQRGGLIVSVVTDPGTSETGIKPTSANALMRALSSSATWERFDARAGHHVPTDPPARHVNVLFDAESYQHLPVLRGIARQPYLRPDGSLMTRAGFDAITGMFGAFDERAFKVAAAPGKDAAAKALKALRDLLTEFSFGQPHDEAAALSMLLTAAIRPTLPVAPMYHVKAPQIASGKSYLSALGSAFAGPSRPAACAFPTTEEETAKLLLSALLEAPPVIVFDNLTSDLIPFKSLCSALTEEFLTGRILGLSKTATVPTNTLIISSGNNVDAVRDMARRTVTITLDPACEVPAARRFEGDPLATVRQHREQFVSHAITIVRAYIEAECPAQNIKPLGSYGDWSRLARAPLVWLGLPDPAAVVFARMAEDPDRETLARLLAAWRSAFGDAAKPVRELVERAERISVGDGDADLKDVVREIAEERGSINRWRLGRWIARHQGRLVKDLKFVRSSKSGGSERWAVVGLVVSGVSSSRGGKTVSEPEPELTQADTEVFE